MTAKEIILTITGISDCLILRVPQPRAQSASVIDITVEGQAQDITVEGARIDVVVP